jgi:hypothetical protein
MRSDSRKQAYPGGKLPIHNREYACRHRRTAPLLSGNPISLVKSWNPPAIRLGIARRHSSAKCPGDNPLIVWVFHAYSIPMENP